MDIKGIKINDIQNFFKDEKIKVYIVLGGAVLGILLYSTLAILPKTGSFFNTRKERNELKKQIDLVSDRVKMIANRIRRTEGLEKELEGYSEGLPAQKEIPEFLEGLSAIAAISGVKILSITPSGLKDAKDAGGKGHYKEMSINITAESGYHQLGQFISNLESGSRFISIEDLRIQNNENSPRKHDVKLTLKTYVSEQ